jgi:hypothetical protein
MHRRRWRGRVFRLEAGRGANAGLGRDIISVSG